jgi:hypothetical protein
MLQRLNSSLDEERLSGDGLWSRARLEEMDSAFTGAVLRAFELGLESRGAAGATVSFRNGKAAAIEGAIELLGICFAVRRGRCRPQRSLLLSVSGVRISIKRLLGRVLWSGLSSVG